MSGFAITFETQASTTLLLLSGELDAYTANELESAVQKCIDEKCYQIIINGAALRYISSAGLGVFMAHIEELRENGGDLKFAALQPAVFDTFDLLGFPHLFGIFANNEEALAAFNA
jgi:anti-sigma B factor antagonist